VPASESKPGGGSSGQGDEKLRDQRKVEPPKANVGKGSCGVCEDTYDIIEPIGGGTYGDVFKARAKADGPNAEIVALKRLKMDEKTEGEGMPITAIREIHILRQLEHENIVRLIEVAVSDPRSLEPGMIYMVFEYMEHDLTGMLSNMIARLTSPEVKSILKQLLTGLHYCHSHSVLHRDLKPANLLLSKDGVLKLADYGLARILSSNERRQYTNKVVTLWYRAPELLLGSRKYSAEIDVWSVGCIFAEILSASAQDAANTANVKQHKIGKPIFPGEKEEEQLNYIFYVLGYPTGGEALYACSGRAPSYFRAMNSRTEPF
jgi:cyclin-dependent kinase 12/13